MVYYRMEQATRKFPALSVWPDVGQAPLEFERFSADRKAQVQAWGGNPAQLTKEEERELDQQLKAWMLQEESILKCLGLLEGLARENVPVESAKEFARLLPEWKHSGKPEPKPQQLLQLEETLQLQEFQEFEKLERPEKLKRLQNLLDTKDPKFEKYRVFLELQARYPEFWAWRQRWDKLEKTLPADAQLQRATARMIEAEYAQIAALMVADCRRVVTLSSKRFGYAQPKAQDHTGGTVADVFGVISAVSGVLALVPVLNMVAGPIAIISATVAVSSRLADMGINNSWDDTSSWASVAVDSIGMIPGVRAVAAAAKTGMRATSYAASGVKLVSKVRIAASSGGRRFWAECGSQTIDAAYVFQYLGTKVGKLSPVLARNTAVIAKSMQGAFDLGVQVPTLMTLAGAKVDPTAQKIIDYAALGRGSLGESALAKPGPATAVALFAVALKNIGKN